MTDLFGWDKEDVEEEESDDNDRSDDEGRMVQKKKKKLKVEDAAKKAGGKNKKFVLEDICCAETQSVHELLLMHGLMLLVHTLSLLWVHGMLMHSGSSTSVEDHLLKNGFYEPKNDFRTLSFRDWLLICIH